MNLKRIFGAVLTILGISALIYAGVVFSNTGGNSNQAIRNLIIYAVLGLVFFSSGISLIRTTKDES